MNYLDTVFRRYGSLVRYTPPRVGNRCYPLSTLESSPRGGQNHQELRLSWLQPRVRRGERYRHRGAGNFHLCPGFLVVMSTVSWGREMEGWVIGYPNDEGHAAADAAEDTAGRYWGSNNLTINYCKWHRCFRELLSRAALKPAQNSTL